MTPEEIAKELAAKWFVFEPYMYGDRAPELVADIAQTIRDAYERAALAVEAMDDEYTSPDVADMIQDWFRQQVQKLLWPDAPPMEGG
mgnify:CR=1 FL=1